jgi:hypothetical protein
VGVFSDEAIFAVPLLTFRIFMGTAIISMMLLLATKSFPVPVAVPAAMAILVVVAPYLTGKFLKEIKEA